MRIWSLHPKHLDAKGLVALWRETLLAKKVLAGHTKGYTHHPQLWRFKQTTDPLAAINQYLAAVYEEACARGYCFDREKIQWDTPPVKMAVTAGQVAYEKEHLLRKLQQRDPSRYAAALRLPGFELHPMFEAIPGGIEPWEVVL